MARKLLRAGELVGELLRLGEVQCALVDGPAGDGTDNALLLRLAQAAHVFQVADAAAGDHRHAERLGERDSSLEVHAGKHAVTSDVGMDDRLYTVVLELLRQVDD